MDFDDVKKRYVWNQKTIPVVLRRNKTGQLLRIRLPYGPDNRSWLKSIRPNGHAPIWKSVDRYWELPRAWFNDFVDNALQRYGRLYVFQPYREQEKCSPQCLDAAGHECECSCMGANRGSGNDGSWFEISDRFACRWGDRFIACRLMVAKKLRTL